MDLKSMLSVSSSGLRAQSLRMRIVAENMANADSVAKTPGGEPYRRRMTTFQAELGTMDQAGGVEISGIVKDNSDFVRTYEPGHPAADADGYVLRPNVNLALEQADMKSAQRSYSANLNAIEAAKSMAMRTIDLLR
jgi:flagellar basal-body rod protein FlgC